MIHNTFGIPIVPENDVQRVAMLHHYEIVGSSSETSFDKIAQLAVKIFNVPIALVALVDSESVFFKANVGMGKIQSVDRGISLCSLAILNNDVTVFEDALKEPCLLANPLVVGNFGLRFYAGAPLKTYNNYNIGTICIVDKAPRLFPEEDRKLLEDLAAIVMDKIELRYSALRGVKAQKDLAKGIAPATGLDYKMLIQDLSIPLQQAIDQLRPPGILNGIKLKLNVKSRPDVLIDAGKMFTAFYILIENFFNDLSDGDCLEIDITELHQHAYIVFKNSKSELIPTELNKLFLTEEQNQFHSGEKISKNLNQVHEIVFAHYGKIRMEAGLEKKSVKILIEMPLGRIEQNS